ncbi:hypothetical protein VAC51_00016 [Variovorax phage VAC_51]|uniref:Uncharacterized protein n=1 Tax=Variovorax phage VAC_51 TaxID=2985242 RepID=A0A9N6WZQ6_9CAUD|nr:hypothetical protein VAC51_00016 [Variovorax phage VAC_51]
MPALKADCRCEPSFTCGHCLRNMKPWHWTPSDPAQPKAHVCTGLCGACCLPDPGRREPFVARYQRGKT